MTRLEVTTTIDVDQLKAGILVAQAEDPDLATIKHSQTNGGGLADYKLRKPHLCKIRLTAIPTVPFNRLKSETLYTCHNATSHRGRDGMSQCVFIWT